jgi:hypothetical protein
MAVKRRIIWMSDEEWALLTQTAKDRGETISGVIRDFWKVAANPAERATAYERFHTQPFTGPIPKIRK